MGVAFLILLIAASAYAKLNEYCSLCENHTLCHYEGPGKACKSFDEGGVTEAEKQLILAHHNFYRRYIANGQERRGKGGPQPKAANLMELTWDNELAMLAQAWADQCLFEHETCLLLPRWRYGQNIFMTWRVPIVKESNWTQAIESWYEEVAIFNPEEVKSYKHKVEIGHYTQLLWHHTEYVGCGRRVSGPNQYYICNYGPNGNIVDDIVYTIGEPCSKCPANTVCNKGLCSYGNKTFGTSVHNVNQPLTNHLITRNKEQNNLINKFNDTQLSEMGEVTTTDTPTTLGCGDFETIYIDEEIKQEIEDMKIRIQNLLKLITDKEKALEIIKKCN